MICLIQRVTQGKVEVDQVTIGEIQSGLVVLTAFQPKDSQTEISKMINKLLNYRLFTDNNGKMNLNIQQVKGSLLLVPQFTLTADTNKGLRPSFSSSAKPEVASQLFDQFVEQIQSSYQSSAIQTGRFGADMQVSLTNDGPVTFWLEV